MTYHELAGLLADRPLAKSSKRNGASCDGHQCEESLGAGSSRLR